MAATPDICTRLAPSPTGQLHLGNVWSFLIAWLVARRQQGRVLLRIDDIDPGRCHTDLARDIIGQLQWLGLDWDGEPLWQSRRGDIYQQALTSLQRQNLLYPCFCSRKEIRSVASAPHLGDPIYPYSGKCGRLSREERQQLLASGRQYALRFRAAGKSVAFPDLLQGNQEISSQAYGGDFVVKRADGVWAYNLATAVDDASCGVNFVVRGQDLLPSTPPQILLHQALGHTFPSFGHLPLLMDEDGQRLAKRHYSLSVATLKDRGIQPEAIIGFLGNLATGQCGPVASATPRQLLDSFPWPIIPKENIIISPSMLKALS